MTIQQHAQLSEMLWYKIGGAAKYLLKCENKEDIYQALEFIEKNNIKRIFVCGVGSNLVFTDEYFDGAVIQIAANDNNPNDIQIEKDQTIEAFAGCLLDDVITLGFRHNLIGLEWAGGLPGTVGAAVRGNVGAYGGEIKDTLISAEVLVRNQTNGFETKIINNADLNFFYRHSLIKDNPGNMIVLSARFNLKTGSPDEVQKARNIYTLYIKQRQERHPLEYPNCGSVFKNLRNPEKIEKVLTVYPEIKDKIETQWYGKVAVGYLIQRIGLQGYRIGDAQVSMKHALFIVNLGHAKARDVLSIVDTIQSKFIDTFGFRLELEVEVVR